jgi:hypothetical protein
MPSQRRMRLFGVLFLVTVVVILYMTRSSTQTHVSDFYTKTSEALQQHEFAEAAKQRDAESVGTRLKAAEEAAKKNADEKSAEYHKAVEGKDKSVAGRVVMEGAKGTPVPGVAAQGGRPRDQAAMKEHETPEDHDVELELNAILKKSPGASLSTRSLLEMRNEANTATSNRLLQILLPLLQARETHPSRKIHDHARALRRRAGRAPARRKTAGHARPDDRPPHGAERPGARQEHRRRRRYAGARRDGQAD